MVVSIEDRSVTFIPLELESPLQLEPCCLACKSSSGPLRTCSSCKLVSYCSKECQACDWGRHKKEDECVEFKKARRKVDECKATTRANTVTLMQEAIERFGPNAFLGRRVPDEMDMDDEAIIDLLAGRFLEFELTAKYLESFVLLSTKICDVATRHNTRTLWEIVLKMAVEVNRLSHVSDPDMERTLASILLRLHRDDDAMACLYYWLERKSLGPEAPADTNWIHSNKGDWAFPVCDNVRFTDIFRKIADLHLGDDLLMGAELIMIPFTIKLRHICVYRNLSTRGDAFLGSVAGESLPADIGKHIISFLTCGESGENLYKEQMNHAHALMNFIDSVSPHALPGIVDPSLVPQGHEEGQQFDMSFVGNHGGSVPVMETLTDMIKERYGL